VSGVRIAGVRAPARGAAPTGTPRLAAGLGGAAVALFVLVGLAGESATAPPLGPHAWHPPYDLALGLPPAVVDVALVAAYLLAGAAVWLGLRAVEAGWRPPARAVLVAGLVAVGALVLVPPIGSADHLSYAAYGRIAAEGGDPYLTAPDAWPPGDPVVGAAEAPWDDTTSVYGPVATAVQAAAARLGDGSLRLTVWLWQVLVGVAWLVAAWLLDRLARLSDGDRGRARVAVLWTLNPLLLGCVVGGAHLDALSAAAAVACLALGVRGASSPAGFLAGQAAAGVALAVAAGTKLPYAAAGAAVVWAHRRFPWRAQVAAAAAMLGTALAVLVPAHLWAGAPV
jgi:hypothetical protein